MRPDKANGKSQLGRGFDFTAHMRTIVTDMVSRLPELAHINLDSVAFAFAQARKKTHYGIHASLTPMRFKNGARTTVKRGAEYMCQQLLDSDGKEMLYILTFYLPRFMDVIFDEKLVTILHELWHISPDFNGDIRRHPGRCYAHTQSQKEYDKEMKVLADRWLTRDPPEEIYSFLRYDFQQLQREHGQVWGTKIPHPKMIRIS
ncbi:MAG: hypothetical protein KDB27_26845, partial [Planctomycetales bacterium]|nr:hypothetical protein [Planctomycetales bacterium]